MISISLQEQVREIARVGGKALNLMKLRTFNVPEGICLTTEAYHMFCERNGLYALIEKIMAHIDYKSTESVKRASETIKTLIMGGEIPEEILNVIHAVTYDNVVVRSSASLEDLPEASFAGQQETVLNPIDVEDAVKQCWASLWTERAISYRHSRGLTGMPTMAVILQRGVPCDVSGVVFTRNPVTHTDDIVVEAVFGLGESLVGGGVSPDRYVLDSALRVKEREAGKKEYKTIFTGRGTERREAEAGECLTEEMLRKIGETALRVEAVFGKPQDIEFGIYKNEVYIFQSRDITTRREDVWTRGYSDDYWTGVTSPLFYSLLGEFLDVYVNKEGNQIMGYTELEGVDLLKYHKAHAYFNTRVLREVFKYNPKFSRVKELLDYFPPHEREEMRELPFNVWRRLKAELRIALLDWDGTLFNTYRKYEAFSQKYVKVLRAFDAVDLRELSDHALLEKYQYLYRACLKHYRLIRWGVAAHNMGMNMILKDLVTRWYRNPDETCNILVSGLPRNKATETNDALFSLARLGDRKAVEQHLGPFLEEYGHRSYSRDIIFPRWAESPELVLDIVDSLSESGKDIGEVERKKREEREALTRDVLKVIENQTYGIVKKKLFETILFYAQTYIAFRENQRFFLDHQTFRFRKVFLEMGRRLEERGILQKRDDVFFLFKEEVFRALETGEVDYDEVEKRKREFAEYEDTLPPKFLQGGSEYDEEIYTTRAEMKGVASSPGVAEGKIRVVKTIHELYKVKEGEIMVATCTDPGWTPVFLKIKGLITETGGILSHGAVVSREYGIPAVTGVKNALKVLKDGDTVVVDGNAGRVIMK